MLAWLLRRLVFSFLSLILASLLVFSSSLIIPGDPVRLIVGLNAEKEVYNTVKTKLGFDKPPLERYWQWLNNLTHGNFGESIMYSKPIKDLIIERLPLVLILIGVSALISMIFSLILGATAALSTGKILDTLIISLSSLGLAIPSFWLGLILVIIFSINWRLLPANGFVSWQENPIQAFKYLVLPVITLSLIQISGLTRIIRASLLDILNKDYIRTAKSKGLDDYSVIKRHALRNAFINIITVLANQISQLLTGAIIIEEVFKLPGLGSLALRAVESHDFLLVQTIVFLAVIVIVLLNLILDIIYTLIDPRITYQ